MSSTKPLQVRRKSWNLRELRWKTNDRSFNSRPKSWPYLETRRRRCRGKQNNCRQSRQTQTREWAQKPIRLLANLQLPLAGKRQLCTIWKRKNQWRWRTKSALTSCKCKTQISIQAPRGSQSISNQFRLTTNPQSLIHHLPTHHLSVQKS